MKDPNHIPQINLHIFNIPCVCGVAFYREVPVREGQCSDEVLVEHKRELMEWLGEHRECRAIGARAEKTPTKYDLSDYNQKIMLKMEMNRHFSWLRQLCMMLDLKGSDKTLYQEWSFIARAVDRESERRSKQ